MNTNAHRTIGQIAIARFALLLLLTAAAQPGFAGCDGFGFPTGGCIDVGGGAAIYFTTNEVSATVVGGSGLSTLTIPSTFNGLPVTGIGPSAFAVNSLTSVTIPDSVTNIGDQAFYSQTILTNVTLGNGVTHIGSWAFDSCIALTSLTIPDSVTSIGDQTFFQCSSLTGITIPTSVTSIGSAPFSGCTSMSAITVDPFNASYSSVNGVLFDKNLTTLIQCPGLKAGSYYYPPSVTHIGNGAFIGCTNLTSVTLRSNLVSIGDSAFSDCTLTSLTIPNGATNLGDRAFFHCTSLTNVVIGNLVSSVGNDVFNSCLSLRSVTIGTNVNKIGGQSFYDCRSLTSITIPNSVTNIGISAFEFCHSLRSVTIGNGVTRIGSYAFYYCNSVTNVMMGNGVTSIGYYAFSSCDSLSSIYFQGDAPGLDNLDVFYPTFATVYYLPGTTGWGTTFGGLLTTPWFLPTPLILNSSPSFGVRTNAFGFIISWATNIPVVVEACANLATQDWSPVATNTLTGGWSYFSDPDWTNYPSRIYRVRSP